MTVFRRIAKLNVTREEINAYSPPRGIIASELEWVLDRETGKPKNQAVMEFACSDYQPEEMLRKNLSDIRYHLHDGFWRNRIVEDAITYHPKSARRIYRIEAILDHPLITGKPIRRRPGGVEARRVDVPLAIRKAAEEAGDVHEISISPARMASQLVIATRNNEPFWIKPKYVNQERQRVVRGPEEVVEQMGPLENKFDYGTIEEG